MTTEYPHALDAEVWAADMRFRTATTLDLRLHRARALVAAKFARGDYSDVLQSLDEGTRDALARALVDGAG